MQSDDEFTREPLGSTTQTPHSGSRMDDYDPTEAPLPDDEFIREPLGSAKSATGGRQRRTARQALLVIGGCVALAVTILVSTGTAGMLWQQARLAWLQHNTPTLTRTTITPRPAARRTLSSGWQQQAQMTLPTPDLTSYDHAPNDPNTWYGCSAAQTTATGGQRVGPLTFWYSHDTGQHWSSVRLPATKDTYCSVFAAPDAPGRLILLGRLYSGCTNEDAFQSMDGGATWYAIPLLPNAPAPDNSCYVSLWFSARHLYLRYGFTTESGPPQNRISVWHSRLWRSDNGGQTWKQLDANFPPGGDGAYFQTLDDGETLLLSLPRFTSPPQRDPEHVDILLWVSHDAGDSWKPWVNVQGPGTGSLQMETQSPSLTPSLAHPIYFLSGATIPTRLLRIRITQVTDMRHWAPLPPLPIAGATPEHLGITSVLAVTASGKLLVFGLGPDDHIPADDALQSSNFEPAQQWLWEWDPQASRWTLLLPPLNIPFPKLCSDHCWQGQLAPAGSTGEAGTNLWVQAFFLNDPEHWDGADGVQKIFHILLPDPV